MEESCPATPPFTSPGRKSPSLPSTSDSDQGNSKTPGRESPDTNCVICLGKLQSKSFTDSCLHQFCFKCLLQWSKVKAECPLCKQPFKSIIHNVRSIMDFDQYQVEAGPNEVLDREIEREIDRELGRIINVRSVGEINASNVFTYNFNVLPVRNRFRYRTTRTREHFQEIAQSWILSAYRDEGRIPPSQRPPTRPRQVRPAARKEFRRCIYQRNLWVQELPDVSGRYRECTPEFYRENPAQTHRLVPWLKRELSVLLETPINPSCLMAQILTLLTRYSILSDDFRNRLRPFLLQSTDHFVHEFYTFARSAYDLQGFDTNASYEHREVVSADDVFTLSHASEDSDIEILDSRITEAVIPINYDIDRPGPSGLSNNNSQPETINISDTDTNDDVEEVIAINYVKPEPEIIVLSSSEGETKQPDRHNTPDSYVEPISDIQSSSDSYNPRNARKKNKAKKSKKTKSKKLKILSSSSDSEDDKPLIKEKSKRNKRLRRKSSKKIKYDEETEVSSSYSSSDSSDQLWKKQKLKSCVVQIHTTDNSKPSSSGYKKKRKRSSSSCSCSSTTTSTSTPKNSNILQSSNHYSGGYSTCSTVTYSSS